MAKEIKELKEIRNLETYYGIIFDWKFNNSANVCPGQYIVLFEKFLSYLNDINIKFASNVYISKKYYNDSVGTILEFTRTLKSFEKLIPQLNILKCSIIRISNEGDLLENNIWKILP